MIDTRWMELTHRDQGFSVSSVGGFVSYHEPLPYHHRKKKERRKVPTFRGSYCLRSLEDQSTDWITEVHSFCQCYNSYHSSTVKNTVVT